MNSPPREPFTVLDWIGTAVVGLWALGCLCFGLALPAWRRMLQDFGDVGALPTLTRLVLEPWLVPGMGLVAGVLLGVGLRAGALSTRRKWVLGAFALVLVATAVCLTGLYLPILTLAGAIEE